MFQSVSRPTNQLLNLRHSDQAEQNWNNLISASEAFPGQFGCERHRPVLRLLLLPHLLHRLRLVRDRGDQPEAEGRPQGPERGAGERALLAGEGSHIPARGALPEMAVPQHR